MEEPKTVPPRGRWIWELLRLRKRREIDRVELDLVLGASEKRQYAGDPNQDPAFHVRTRNK